MLLHSPHLRVALAALLAALALAGCSRGSEDDGGARRDAAPGATSATSAPTPAGAPASGTSDSGASTSAGAAEQPLVIPKRISGELARVTLLPQQVAATSEATARSGSYVLIAQCRGAGVRVSLRLRVNGRDYPGVTEFGCGVPTQSTFGDLEAGDKVEVTAEPSSPDVRGYVIVVPESQAIY